MALQNSSEQRTFKNTFAPHIENEVLTVHDIIAGLKTTVLHSKDLPTEVQDAVEDELERMHKDKSRKNSPAERAKA